MLEMNNIYTSYGPVPMLKNVSLKVPKGQLVCLIGPNGAGKSTSFNTICGLQKIDKGNVKIIGHNMHNIGPEKLASIGVGFVPEGRRLFPNLTVLENLRLAFDAGKTKLNFNERLEAMTALLPRIKERLSQAAGTMSGGEQAMVAFARALIADPELLIMDEPSLGLSPKLIDEYFDIVVQIRNLGKTVFLIEQNVETVLSIANYCYLLIRGEIISAGTREEMRSNDIIKNMYL